MPQFPFARRVFCFLTIPFFFASAALNAQNPPTPAPAPAASSTAAPRSLPKTKAASKTQPNPPMPNSPQTIPSSSLKTLPPLLKFE